MSVPTPTPNLPTQGGDSELDDTHVKLPASDEKASSASDANSTKKDNKKEKKKDDTSFKYFLVWAFSFLFAIQFSPSCSFASSSLRPFSWPLFTLWCCCVLFCFA